jgi:hypothetical protein
VLSSVASLCALAATGFAARSGFGAFAQPIDNIHALNGCYEGEGMPDFMRPRNRSKAFRFANGMIFDREGQAISNIRIVESGPSTTTIGFSPGILIYTSTDGAKRTEISAGPTETAEAFMRGERAYISIPERLFDLHTTTCG